MHQNTKANSLYVKAYLEINLILTLILILVCAHGTAWQCIGWPFYTIALLQWESEETNIYLYENTVDHQQRGAASQ